MLVVGAHLVHPPDSAVGYRCLIPECRSTNARVTKHGMSSLMVAHRSVVEISSIQDPGTSDVLDLGYLRLLCSCRCKISLVRVYVYGRSCVRGWKRERVSLSFDFFFRPFPLQSRMAHLGHSLNDPPQACFIFFNEVAYICTNVSTKSKHFACRRGTRRATLGNIKPLQLDFFWIENSYGPTVYEAKVREGRVYCTQSSRMNTQG